MSAAGLSGLAQAVYLASGATLDASPTLRFGIGAWPAVAAAIAAHLLYLLTDHGLTEPRNPGEPDVADLLSTQVPGAHVQQVPSNRPTAPLPDALDAPGPPQATQPGYVVVGQVGVRQDPASRPAGHRVGCVRLAGRPSAARVGDQRRYRRVRCALIPALNRSLPPYLAPRDWPQAFGTSVAQDFIFGLRRHRRAARGAHDTASRGWVRSLRRIAYTARVVDLKHVELGLTDVWRFPIDRDLELGSSGLMTAAAPR